MWVDGLLASAEVEDVKILRLMDYIDPVEEEIVEGMTILVAFCLFSIIGMIKRKV